MQREKLVLTPSLSAQFEAAGATGAAALTRYIENKRNEGVIFGLMELGNGFGLGSWHNASITALDSLQDIASRIHAMEPKEVQAFNAACTQWLAQKLAPKKGAHENSSDF